MKPTTILRNELTEKDQERFWARVDRLGPDQCWPWLNYLNNNGYGHFRITKGIEYAHRVAYALTHGSTPEGLTLDHTCTNKQCCNPAHLEPVSQSVNIKRWWAKQDTSRCACGAPRRDGGRDTRCKACFNAYMREYNAKRKAMKQ